MVFLLVQILKRRLVELRGSVPDFQEDFFCNEILLLQEQ